MADLLGLLWPPFARTRTSIVLITDPGPDPDDVKALLVLSTLHTQRVVHAAAVIANGGHQQHARAKLARCILDHVGAADVPVGVGTAGRPYEPQPHEYALEGFERVDGSRLHEGSALLRRVLRAAPHHGLTVVIISGFTDLADVIHDEPALVCAKVARVCVQGGLEADASAPGAYRADSSVNCGYDPPAADAVYRFCFSRGIPMTVVSRHAIPMLPMQLARSFALRFKCPIMRYLADAQFLGLEGLWLKLCEGRLPPRCTKQWYFETFCGVERAEFDVCAYEDLDQSAHIAQHLNGYVKPYDVVALMAALPHTAHLLHSPDALVSVRPTARGARGGGRPVPHLLLLSAEHALPPQPVLELLRETYHAVVLATTGSEGVGAAADGGAPGSPDVRRQVRDRLAHSATPPAHRPARDSYALGAHTALPVPGGALSCNGDGSGRTLSAKSPRPPAADAAGGGEPARCDSAAAAAAARAEAGSAQLLHPRAIEQLCECAIDSAHSAFATPTRLLGLLSVLAYALWLGSLGLRLNLGSKAGPPPPWLWLVRPLSALALNIAFACAGVALLPIRRHRPPILALALALLTISATTAYGTLRPGLVLTELRPAPAGAALVDMCPAARAHVGLTRAVGATYLCTCACSVHAVCVLGGVLLGPARSRELHRLLGTVWRVFGARALLAGTLNLITALRCCTVQVRLGPVLGVQLLLAAVQLATAASLLWRSPRSTREHALLLLMRLRLCAPDAQNSGLAPLAVLLGEGGATSARRARHVVRDSLALFHAEPLGAAERAELVHAASQHAHPLASVASPRGSFVRRRLGGAAGPLGSAGGGGGGGGGGGELRLRRRSRTSAPPPPPPSPKAARHLGWEARRAGGSLRPSGGAAPLGGLARAAADAAPWADAYVLHAASDDVGARARALCAWAAAFEAQHARVPRVWLDDMCEDPGLSASEQLAQLPARLGRCRRLVLLCSPALFETLQHAVALYAWRVVGGSVDAADAVLLGGGASARADVVTAVDTYHSMYSSYSSGYTVDGPGARVPSALLRFVELSNVAHFNEVVRAYLPRVRSALAAGAAAEAGAEAEARAAERSSGAGPAAAARAPVGGVDVSAATLSDAATVVGAPATVTPPAGGGGAKGQTWPARAIGANGAEDAAVVLRAGDAAARPAKITSVMSAIARQRAGSAAAAAAGGSSRNRC